MKKTNFLKGSKDLLHRSFKPDKCKTSLRLVMSRLKLLRNKKEVQVRQMRREVSQLLESGQDQTARIRVEHVVREEKMMSAYELIALYSELIMARMSIIESQKNCPIDLKEAITSIIFASPRCGDVPELEDVRKQFSAKYGKDFINAAIELRPDCGVSRLLIEKLSAKAPDGQAKLKILTSIAEEYSIQWDPKSFGDKEATPSNDLLSGPSTESKKPYEPHLGYEAPTPQMHAQTLKPDQGTQNYNNTPTSGGGGTTIPSASHHQRTDSGTHVEKQSQESSYMDNRKSGKMEFKDAGSAAQAAAESAEQAAMAARAAAQFANRERATRDKHSSSESETEHIHKESTATYKHHKSHNEEVEHDRNNRRVDQSSYDSPKRQTRQSSRSKSSFDDAENYSRKSPPEVYDSPKRHSRKSSSSFDGTHEGENYSRSRDKKISTQSEYDDSLKRKNTRQSSSKSKSSFDGTHDTENYSRSGDKKISEYDSPRRPKSSSDNAETYSRKSPPKEYDSPRRPKSSFDNAKNYSRKSPPKEYDSPRRPKSSFDNAENYSRKSPPKEYDSPKSHSRKSSSKSEASFDDDYLRKSLPKENKNIYDSPKRHSRKNSSRSEASFDDDSLVHSTQQYNDHIEEKSTSKQSVTSSHSHTNVFGDDYEYNESNAMEDYEPIHIGSKVSEHSDSDNDNKVVYDSGPKFDEPHFDDVFSSGRVSPINVFSNPNTREDEVKFDDSGPGPTKYDNESESEEDIRKGNQIYSSVTEEENHWFKEEEYDSDTNKRVDSPKIHARGPHEESSELELAYSHEGDDSDRSEGLMGDSDLGSKLNFGILTGGLKHKKGINTLPLPPYTRKPVQKVPEESSVKDFESFPSSRNTNLNLNDHKSSRKEKKPVVSESDSSEDEILTRQKPKPKPKPKPYTPMLKVTNDYFGSESEEDLPKPAPIINNNIGDRISRRTKPTPGTSKVRPLREKPEVRPLREEPESMWVPDSKPSFREERVKKEAVKESESRDYERGSSRKEIQESKPSFKKESVKSSSSVEKPISPKKKVDDDVKDVPESSRVLNREDSSKKPSHVHPNLPDADSFFAAFRKKS